MAADWIHLERHPDDAKIAAIAALAGATPEDTFCAAVRWFYYVDRHVEDGQPTPKRVFNAVVKWENDTLIWAFASPGVQWISVVDDDIYVLEFDEWFSKSSKQRRLAAKRQANKRSRDRHAKVTHQRDTSVTRRDETRREKTITSSACAEDSLSPPDEAAEGNGHVSKPRKPKQPDAYWDAIVAEFHESVTDDKDRKRVGNIVSRFRAKCNGADPVAVLARLRAAYATKWPHVTWTAHAMLNHWGALAAAAETPLKLLPGTIVERDPRTCGHRLKDNILGRVRCIACDADLGPVENGVANENVR